MNEQIENLQKKIEALEKERNYWMDKSRAIATEAAMLWDLAEDQENADKLLSEYNTIVFYAHKLIEGKEAWVRECGKLIGHSGVEFGVYFDGFEWHIVELQSGKSIGSVEEYRESFVHIELVMKNVGKEKVLEKSRESLEESGPLPQRFSIVPWRSENPDTFQGDEVTV